jgi:hypothetical protein
MSSGPRRLSVLGLGRIFIYRNAGGPNTVEPACGANAQKLAVLLVDCDGHAEREEQSPVGIFDVLNLSSPEVSFFEMNSNTFLESASALQATIGVATLAACAKVGKSSARIATSR